MNSTTHIPTRVSPLQDGVGEETPIFSHAGITVEKGYKVRFSPEAQSSLQELILEIQQSFPIENSLPQTEFVVSDISEATADVLIEKKEEGKVKKLIARILRRKKGKLGEKGENKLHNTLQKHSPPIFQNVIITYTDEDGQSKEFLVPLIIRPGRSLKQTLHSLEERAKLRHSNSKN